MLRFDDAQWKAFESQAMTARFLAGERTGHRGVDAVIERIERLKREKEGMGDG